MNNTSMENATSSTECNVSQVDLILVCGYCILFLAGSLGNTLVIIVFRNSLKENGSTFDMLIFFLAICDLASSIISPTLIIYWILTCNFSWHFGIVACKLVPTITRVLTDISIGTMLIMAIDRCHAISQPLKQRLSKSFITRMFLLTVFLAILCQVYYARALELRNGGPCDVDVYDPTYSIPLVILTVIRALAFLLIFWITTLTSQIALRKSTRNCLLRASQKQRVKRRARTTRMLILMAFIFTITVIPRDMLHLAYTLSHLFPGLYGIPYSNAIRLVNKALRWLQTSNCIYNVFIYGKMHYVFGENVKHMMKCGLRNSNVERESDRNRSSTFISKQTVILDDKL